MHRILVVLKAGDVYPSGVTRGLVYRDHFRSHRYDAEYVSWLSPTLMRLLERPPRWIAPLLRASGGAAWREEGCERRDSDVRLARIQGDRVQPVRCLGGTRASLRPPVEHPLTAGWHRRRSRLLAALPRRPLLDGSVLLTG